MFIKPVSGRRVPDPEKGGFVPPEGRVVADHDQYWLRRIADGDVVKADPKPAPAKGGKAK
jgi:hypothetical protein